MGADEASSRIPGFHRLEIARRRRQIAAFRGLDERALALFDRGGIDLETADGMVENVVGTLALPLGVAVNFLVDQVEYVVPMAIEEPSVIAAASNAAKIVRQGGGFRAAVSRPVMTGQVQLVHVPDPEAASRAIGAARPRILALARAKAPRLVERGGGPVDLRVRVLAPPGPPDGAVLVVHLLVDCRDAMGGNLVNSLLEAIAGDLAALARGQVGLCIVSNLSDERTVDVTARVGDAALCDRGRGAEVRRGIAAASRFAELDPYRAATHNKGIMNGIDAVLLATGNDWRNVEAGAHAYACRGGQYRPLAVWREEDDTLVGRLVVPMAVGIVGGALHLHAGARLALTMLAVRSAAELAAVVGAVGLATNLAALRALATEGIQRGHMALHARVVARGVGATSDLIDRVAQELLELGDVSSERARETLDRLRSAEVSVPSPSKERS